MMRIITGRARGVRLDTLAGENTRPTSERAKEAVFSMLQFEIQGKEVLDLFAGSGQMGLEAVSRGAKTALLCDHSREAVAVIRSNAIKTKLAPFCEIVCSDYTAVLRNCRRKKSFDLVFLDPPYASDYLPRALRGLLEGQLLSPGAILVCESGDPNAVFGKDSALAESYRVLRSARYGIAYVTYLSLENRKEAEGKE